MDTCQDLISTVVESSQGQVGNISPVNRQIKPLKQSSFFHYNFVRKRKLSENLKQSDALSKRKNKLVINKKN